MEDSLERIFRLQEAFDVTVQKYPPFNNWEKEEKVVALLDHIIQESYEARNALGTTITGRKKWWKQGNLTEEGWSDLHEELADILHFLVSAMINAGMCAGDVLSNYEKKNKINHARQERGY
jgi:dimeric dUTPase (all-alpha-NTP-PPase superfamily)